MADLDNLVGKVSLTQQWSPASKQSSNSDLAPLSNTSAVRVITNYGTNAGQVPADICVSQDVTIAPSAVNNFDLSNLTDVLNQNITNAAHLVELTVRNISVAQNATNGGLSDHVYVGANGGSTAGLCTTFFKDTASTGVVFNGCFLSAGFTVGTGGVAITGGGATGGAHILRLTNGDSVATAGVQVGIMARST